MRLNSTIVLCSLLTLSGCGRMLGLEKDYVLVRPVEIQVEPTRERVTLPAGTQIRRYGFKDDTAFVEILGRTSRRELAEASRPQ